MNSMKYYLGIIAILLITSCQDEQEVNGIDKNDTANNVTIGEIKHYEILFDETEFPDDSHQTLLNELNICDSIGATPTGCSPCIAENFKLLMYKNDKTINDAFLLQVKALTILKGQKRQLPMRHLIIFERENGVLVKVNGFRGKLIATRESVTEAKDLIVRFYVPEDKAFLICLFVWTGAKYRFQSVEAIDGAGGQGAVKAEVKEEVSKEVYQSLIKNSLLF